MTKLTKSKNDGSYHSARLWQHFISLGKKISKQLKKCFATLAQFHKTFYGRNLQMFVIKLANVFVPEKPFQPSLMFVNKARAYQNEDPEGCSTQGYAPGLTKKQYARL
jgi:hypothetical protein